MAVTDGTNWCLCHAGDILRERGDVECYTTLGECVVNGHSLYEVLDMTFYHETLKTQVSGMTLNLLVWLLEEIIRVAASLPEDVLCVG